MILPGEAWLEFKIENGVLNQTATFRPVGSSRKNVLVFGNVPFHWFVFNGMINNIVIMITF